MPRAYSLQSSRFPLFPPVKICLRTGLLGIAGRDQRGLSLFPNSSLLTRLLGGTVKRDQHLTMPPGKGATSFYLCHVPPFF